MGHVIEAAKSGRASCKVCKKKIDKGELRLGEEVPNPFSEGEMSFRWHHLECGAKKKPSVLTEALNETETEVPNKDELLKKAEENAIKEKPTKVPFAEFASSARSSCVHCSEKIDKGDLRLAVNADTDPSGFGFRKGFLHPGCSSDFLDDDLQEVFSQIQTNSKGLEEKDFEAVEAEMFN